MLVFVAGRDRAIESADNSRNLGLMRSGKIRLRQGHGATRGKLNAGDQRGEAGKRKRLEKITWI